MALGKKVLMCATAVLALSCMPSAADAQACASGVGCQKELEVGCAPGRKWFGYHPTTWRRWPTESPAQVPTPATGPSPAPAANERPANIEPDQPTVTPDDANLFPTEPEPSTPSPNIEPDSMLPFDDRPGESPDRSMRESDLPGLPMRPSDTTPNTLPDLPPRVQPSPSQDTPPTMPDDDPFKDDPPQPETPGAAAPSPQSRNTRPDTDSANRQAVLQWRAAAESEVAAAESSHLTAVPAGLEPTLVEPGPARRARTQAMLPTVTPARRNPLRSSAAEPRDAQVVSTAGWTAEAPRTHATTANWRRNPLRTN